MGKWKNILFTGALIPLLLSGLSCASSGRAGWLGLADRGRAILPGVVYDMEALPCSNVGIRLYKEGGERPIRITETDIHGRFFLENLSAGTYRLVFNREGMESGSLTFDYREQSQILYVKIYSKGDLLERAEAAIDMREFNRAREYIRRLYLVSPGDPSVLFLHAVIEKLQGHEEDSQGLLSAVFDHISPISDLQEIFKARETVQLAGEAPDED